ncbi:MAG: hydroxypyruvate isomerase [Novosphingobium sp. 17-62-8]|nr:MAG: hydroxypyruvate isomerase [Novosphingobium sp. 17-62-8]HQS69717.1 TIM barrel protein [Novosphingobium sp.]
MPPGKRAQHLRRRGAADWEIDVLPASTLSTCIEWQFAEAGDLAARIHAAKAQGFAAVEFHLWRDKPVAAMAQALAETGIALTGLCVDPRRSIVDPAERAEMVNAVRETIAATACLGKPPLIVASGFRVEGMSEADHFANAVAALKEAAALAEEAGVMLLLEPLNTRLFSAMYLVSTTLGLDLVEAVGSPNLRLLYDVWHSAVMGEDIAEVLKGRIDLVAHIQVADMDDRNEPGTGTVDWPHVMRTLGDLGYAGAIGMEYFPTLPMDQSLELTRKTLGL